MLFNNMKDQRIYPLIFSLIIQESPQSSLSLNFFPTRHSASSSELGTLNCDGVEIDFLFLLIIRSSVICFVDLQIFSTQTSNFYFCRNIEIFLLQNSILILTVESELSYTLNWTDHCQ